MRLNLDIIRDYIPQGYQAERFGPGDRKLSLSRPLLYERGTAPREGGLYVVRTDALPETPPSGTAAWICVGPQVPPGWSINGPRVLWISNASSVLTVYNAIQEIYDRFDAWDDQLRDELEAEETFSLNQIIEIGSAMLENHIGVADQFLKVIFSSEIIPQADGAFTVAVSEVPFHFPLSAGERVKDICGLEGMITSPFISSMLWKGCRLYCNNLYPLGHYIGSVYIVERYRPFRESDFPLADHFFSYFQRAFLKHLRTVSHVESPSVTAMRNLLNGISLSSEEREQMVLQPGDHWICFKLKEQHSKKYMPRDYMCATIRALMPKTAYAVIYNDAIVGLLRLRGGEVDRTIDLFREILDRMDYTGGFSNTFTDLGKINDYLLQASYVVEKCVPNDPSQPLFFFRDHVLQYMLYECTGKLPLESLYCKGLLALMEHDRKRNTDYIKTLDVYLKNERSITKTAESLYIHRSSLLKRLDKINRLIDEDLDDPDTRLYFRICFSLWENRFGTSNSKAE